MYKHIGAIILVSVIVAGASWAIWYTLPGWSDSGKVVKTGQYYDGDWHYWADVQTTSHGIIRCDESEVAVFLIRNNSLVGVTDFPNMHYYHCEEA